MAFTVLVDLPPAVEEAVRSAAGDLDATTREALLISLYRQGKISHFTLATALGLDRFEVEELLARHNVTEDMGTIAEYLADAAVLEQMRARP